jgi:DNA-binding CsgD family transcriptional regulator
MDRMRRVHELPEPVRNVLKARTGDAVLVMDCDYRIVYWDDRMESLTGTLAEEVVGERCFQVLQGELESGDAFCADGCSLMQLAKEGRPIASHEMRINTRLAQKRWVGISNLTVETEEGAYLVHLLRDSQGAHDTLEMARCLIQLSSKRESLPARRKSDVPTLTPRQLQVLTLLSEGNSVKEMGEELYLAEATIRNHVRSLLQALGAHSQLEVVAKARKKGLLTEGRIECKGAT